ncbi:MULTISPECIES: ABC transporter permease [Vibrio]|uniref:ABC transporter permease n=1 Tax=Vibrio TaxID=662 RepID=UPI00063467C5|nr:MULTISPECIES: ABC transporter permease [Vibrio]MCK8080008.1 ABC transporter permease [Vibrio sp. 1CM24A]MCY9865564.1 ABC transporter permease [Vibrio coralliirubri]CDS97424.1 Ribose transport system permease protein rbsC [Vibrio coralliirubri]CDT10093.1 Ribose transport system permease protein rbsC [Vibrio coralliirubri]CDT47100.1 Ribose transport system permease protein rbsC [Vibrio coralliirubri]
MIAKLLQATSEQPETGKKTRFLSKYAIYVVFVGMCVVMSILSPVFLTVANLLNVMTQMASIGLLALGVTIIIITRGIDLSSGSVLAVAAVVSASTAQTLDWGMRMYPNLPELPVIVPILVALGVGALCGLINGALIAYTGIPPFIATLGMMIIARGAALLYSDGRPISSLIDSYQWIGQGNIAGIPVPVVIFLVMALFTYVLLNYTRFGKYAYAIGGNETAAYVSGINVTKYKILVYVYAGLLAGIAALILTARINSGQPGLGNMYELDAIAAATVGGVSHAGGIGTIQGTIVGTMIMGVLQNGLDLLNVSAYWQQVVKGLVIVVAVIFDMKRQKKSK